MGFESPKYMPESIIGAPEAKIKHVQAPERSRFGNRFFPSPEFAYLDREGDEVKAGLMLSPEGSDFVRNHPGILSRISKTIAELQKKGAMNAAVNARREYGAGKLEDAYYWAKHQSRKIAAFLVGKYHPSLSLKTEGGERMAYIGQGAQSIVYSLQVDKEKYVVKVGKRGKPEDPENLQQPYINEMLQVQELGAELKDELAKARLSLPTPIFASGQVYCTRYEIGEHPDIYSNIRLLDSGILRRVEEYVSERHRAGDTLWKGIFADYKTTRPFSENRRELFHEANFIERKEDGMVVWIDPLKYEKNRREVP